MLKLCKVIALLITFTLLLSVSDVNVSTVKIIRVGHAPNYGIVGDINDTGNEGYGYEYLNKIIEYTKGDYVLEFVECGFMNGYDMLEKGLIDILAPLPEGAADPNTFIFSENPIGANHTFLLAMNPEDTRSYDNINGKSIAVQQYYAETSTLVSFLKEYGLSADIVEMNLDSLIEFPDDFNYDFIVTSSLQLEGDFNIVAKLDSNPVHLMSIKSNASLMADLDYGIEELRKSEYMFEERLNFKYYDYSVNNSQHITQDEFDIIQSQPIYRVGYSPDYSPLSYIDSMTGQLVGVAIDVLDWISADAGIAFEMVDVTADDVDLDSIDWSLMAPAFSNGMFSKVQSEPYFEYPYLLVERSTSGNSADLGILNFYEIPSSIMKRLTLDGDEVVYPNYNELEAAFSAGQIDRIIMTSVMYNNVRSDMQSSYYNITPVSAALDVLIAFKDDTPYELVSVVNKFIERIDDNLIQYSFDEHTSVILTQSLGQFLEDNPFVIRLVVLLGVALVIFVYIVEQHRQADLRRAINIDELTGLLSERRFREVTRETLLDNPDKSYTILSIDIDNFKHINEIYGYEKGSKVIAKIGEYMKEYISTELPIARGVSDSFLVLLETTDKTSKEIIAEYLSDGEEFNKILNLVLDDEDDAQEHDEYNFSFSLGIYRITDPDLDLSVMIDCAEIARDQTSKMIGTTLNEFTDDMSRERQEMNEVVTSMNKALANKEFQVYYQPKVDLITKEIVGAEALVRWHKDNNAKNIVQPGKFIDIFEKNGFIEHLDDYIVKSVCEFIRKNSDTKQIPIISLNLSGITIMQKDLVKKLMGRVNAYDLSPSCIDLEITESAFINNDELGIGKIEELREKGFVISMDDFGAGVSSLNRLKAIPIDVLKIDREFLGDSLDNKKGSTIIRSVIDMAKNLGIETIAEGIESVAQYEMLRDLGCDIGQGYLFYRPMEADKFLEQLPDVINENDD